MNKFQNILLLDDSNWILEEVSVLLTHAGYTPFPALDVTAATKIITATEIDFAIVDLFLLGDSGAELSNNFIEQQLIDTPYLRLTGDPQSVPKHLQGFGVISKQNFRRNPSTLLEILSEAETSLRLSADSQDA